MLVHVILDADGKVRDVRTHAGETVPFVVHEYGEKCSSGCIDTDESGQCIYCGRDIDDDEQAVAP